MSRFGQFVRVVGILLLAAYSPDLGCQVNDGLLLLTERLETFRKENYSLEIRGEKGRLFYYGAFHRVDPRDSQFDDLENKWEAYRPTIAYSEGGLWPLEASRELAIRRYGEQGLLRYLAERDGVPIRCLDPSLSKQVQFLRCVFSTYDIKLYFILRQACIHRMLHKDQEDLRRQAELYLKEIGSVEEGRLSPCTIEEFDRAVADCFPELEEWDQIPDSYFIEQGKGRFLAKIHRRLNGYRDRFMIRALSREIKRGHRVFAVVGRSHVIRQEATLRMLAG